MPVIYTEMHIENYKEVIGNMAKLVAPNPNPNPTRKNTSPRKKRGGGTSPLYRRGMQGEKKRRPVTGVRKGKKKEGKRPQTAPVRRARGCKAECGGGDGEEEDELYIEGDDRFHLDIENDDSEELYGEDFVDKDSLVSPGEGGEGLREYIVNHQGERAGCSDDDSIDDRYSGHSGDDRYSGHSGDDKPFGSTDSPSKEIGSSKTTSNRGSYAEDFEEDDNTGGQGNNAKAVLGGEESGAVLVGSPSEVLPPNGGSYIEDFEEAESGGGGEVSAKASLSLNKASGSYADDFEDGDGDGDGEGEVEGEVEEKGVEGVDKGESVNKGSYAEDFEDNNTIDDDANERKGEGGGEGEGKGKGEGEGKGEGMTAGTMPTKPTTSHEKKLTAKNDTSNRHENLTVKKIMLSQGFVDYCFTVDMQNDNNNNKTSMKAKGKKLLMTDYIAAREELLCAMEGVESEEVQVATAAALDATANPRAGSRQRPTPTPTPTFTSTPTPTFTSTPRTARPRRAKDQKPLEPVPLEPVCPTPCHYCKKRFRGEGQTMPNLLSNDRHARQPASEKIERKYGSPGRGRRRPATSAGATDQMRFSALVGSPFGSAKNPVDDPYLKVLLVEKTTSSKKTVFCAWECVKRHAVKGVPKHYQYEKQMLVDLAAGYIVDI